MKYFADVHFHVMTLKEPNFASFINSFYSSNAVDFLQSNTTDNYLISHKFVKPEDLLGQISNTLTAFERPIGEVFIMMEDDLRGKFSSKHKNDYAPSDPFIKDNKLKIRANTYEKMIMIPLLMDFSQNQKNLDEIYYTFPAMDKISPYAKATIKGMREYYEKRPDGLFEFYPFIGIDPALHSADFIKQFLQENINVSKKMHKDHTIPRKPFYGLKFYPPLGFNPWPNDKEDLEKTRIVYEFAEANEVPIITHCDDQGFRGVPGHLAWKYTDPATWRTVLENYPKLKIDFAHYGKQYATSSGHDLKSIQYRMKGYPASPWFRTIIELMEEFPNVYADLSFTGCYPEFYVQFKNYLETLSLNDRHRVLSRTLFGSDFSVNLLKIESYTEYYSIFANSALSDEEINEFASLNPLRFLGFK